MCISVAETVPERASVQTRTVTLLSEQLLLRSRTTLLFLLLFLFCNTTEHLWPVHTVPFSFCDALFHYPVQCEHSLWQPWSTHTSRQGKRIGRKKIPWVIQATVCCWSLVLQKGRIRMNTLPVTFCNPDHSLLLKSCIREWKNSNEYFTTLCNPSHSLLLKCSVREWKNMNEYPTTVTSQL